MTSARLKTQKFFGSFFQRRTAVFLPERRNLARVEILCFGLGLWLAGPLPVAMLGDRSGDLLYASRAAALLDGGWLGLIGALAHGGRPLYPLFIASAACLGVPLQLATQAVYLSGALCLTRAAALLGLERGAAVFCFALLALNPVCFGTEATTLSPDALACGLTLLSLGLAGRVFLCGAGRLSVVLLCLAALARVLTCEGSAAFLGAIAVLAGWRRLPAARWHTWRTACAAVAALCLAGVLDRSLPRAGGGEAASLPAAWWRLATLGWPDTRPLFSTLQGPETEIYARLLFATPISPPRALAEMPRWHLSAILGSLDPEVRLTASAAAGSYLQSDIRVVPDPVVPRALGQSAGTGWFIGGDVRCDPADCRLNLMDGHGVLGSWPIEGAGWGLLVDRPQLRLWIKAPQRLPSFLDGTQADVVRASAMRMSAWVLPRMTACLSVPALLVFLLRLKQGRFWQGAPGVAALGAALWVFCAASAASLAFGGGSHAQEAGMAVLLLLTGIFVAGPLAYRLA